MKNTNPIFENTIDLLLEGRFQDVHSTLENLGKNNELPTEDEALLRSFFEFMTGKIRRPEASTWYESVAWVCICRSSLAYFMIYGILSFIRQILVLIGLRAKICSYLHKIWAPDLIHYRYTQFEKGTLRWLVLSIFSSDSDIFKRSYYKATLAHGLCEAGRFDLGLQLLLESINYFDSLEAHSPSEYLQYCDSLALTAVHYGYSGHVKESDYYYQQLFKNLKSRPYFWIEVFARTMRLSASVEHLDGVTMFEDSSRVKYLLGKSFAQKYGLRVSIYAALYATLKGDITISREQILAAESYYDGTTVTFELGRYHLIRSLIEIEFSSIVAANHHANEAKNYLGFIPGAILPQTEASLLQLEILLVSLFIEPDQAKLNAHKKYVRKTLRQVRFRFRNAPLFKLKADVLEALFLHLLGQNPISVEKASVLRDQIQKHSKRTLLLLDRFGKPGQAGKHLFSKTLTRVRRDETIVKLLTNVSVSQGSKEACIAALSAILGTDSLELFEYHHDSGNQTGAILISQTEEKLVFALVTTPGKGIRVVAQNPITQLSFDKGVKVYLNLMNSILQACDVQKALLEAERAAAIESTIQMLAHDMRRPFSMVKGMMDLFSNTRDPEKIREISNRFVPQVDRSMSYVHKMLEDLMAADSIPKPEVVSLESLLIDACGDVFTAHSFPGISIEYNLNHKHLLNVDPFKITRSFSNILHNAAQAMEGKGEIIISSKSLENSVEVSFFNSGSYISPEIQKLIFTPHFTEGKKKGSGLGLAIVEKVIHSHKGSIRCESKKNHGTKFVLELPQSNRKSEISAQSLPTIASSEEQLRVTNLKPIHVKPKLNSIKNPKVIRVLVVDDEYAYLTMLKATANVVSGFNVQMIECQNLDDMALQLDSQAFDLIIMDLDLNGASGFDGISLIKKQQPKAYIVVHSNRSFNYFRQDKRHVMCDQFVSKPINQTQLENICKNAVSTVCKPKKNEAKTRQIFVIDDCPLTRWSWETAAPTRVKTFDSPESFWSEISEFRNLLNDSVIVTDFYFGESSAETGLTFAKSLRDRQITCPIVLSSDTFEDYQGFSNSNLITSRVSKSASDALNQIEHL